MRDVLKKNTNQETVEITSIPNNQETESIGKLEIPQFTHSTVDPTPDTDTAELLESLQKANAEEQKLLEIKQNLIETQQELQNKLKEELDKKKKTIANLVTEIPTLQNKCQQLGQVLGVDIYNL
jgi:predicted transcriptional regulator